MLKLGSLFPLAAVGIAFVAAPVSAKGPSPKKLMEISASCAYVVGIAEGNEVQLNYGSADWMNVIRLIEQQTGLDGEQSLISAKAKYNKRTRAMGADEAYNYMLGRSKDCDREMAVFQGS